jgi:hypothetical protein
MSSSRSSAPSPDPINWIGCASARAFSFAPFRGAFLTAVARPAGAARDVLGEIEQLLASAAGLRGTRTQAPEEETRPDERRAECRHAGDAVRNCPP